MFEGFFLGPGLSSMSVLFPCAVFCNHRPLPWHFLFCCKLGCLYAGFWADCKQIFFCELPCRRRSMYVRFVPSLSRELPHSTLRIHTSPPVCSRFASRQWSTCISAMWPVLDMASLLVQWTPVFFAAIFAASLAHSILFGASYVWVPIQLWVAFVQVNSFFEPGSCVHALQIVH